MSDSRQPNQAVQKIPTAQHQSSLLYFFKTVSLPATITAFATSPLRSLMNRSIEYQSPFMVIKDLPTHGVKGIHLNTTRAAISVNIQTHVKTTVEGEFANPQSSLARFCALTAATAFTMPLVALFDGPFTRISNEAQAGQLIRYKNFCAQPGLYPLFRFPQTALAAFFIRDLKFVYTIQYGHEIPIPLFVPSLIIMSSISGFFHNIGVRCLKEDLNLPEQGTQPHFQRDGGVIATLRKLGQGLYTHHSCRVPIQKPPAELRSVDLLMNILSVCCNKNMLIWRTIYIGAFYCSNQFSKKLAVEGPNFFQCPKFLEIENEMDVSEMLLKQNPS